MNIGWPKLLGIPDPDSVQLPSYSNHDVHNRLLSARSHLLRCVTVRIVSDILTLT